MPDKITDDHSLDGMGLEDARVRRILDTVPQMVWSTDAEGHADFFNDRWYAYTGTSQGETDGDRWLNFVHPEDRENTGAAWFAANAAGDVFSVEYRLLRHDGEYRWVIDQGAPLMNSAGDIVRWIGTCTDIEEQKRAEAAHGMIAGELSHRIGNLFSVVIGLVSLSVPRSSPFRADAEKLSARLGALARAHDKFRAPQRYGAGGPTSSLHDLLDGVMKPYAEDNEGRVRVTVDGFDPPVTENHATALALVIHELATNAVKHGALSSESGRIALRVEQEPGGYCLTWRERGGPSVVEPEGGAGFGSGLIRRLAALQLGHEPQLRWHADGLEVAVRVNMK